MIIFKDGDTCVVSRLTFLVDGWQHIHVSVTVGSLVSVTVGSLLSVTVAELVYTELRHSDLRHFVN